MTAQAQATRIASLTAFGSLSSPDGFASLALSLSRALPSPQAISGAVVSNVGAVSISRGIIP